MYDVISVPPIIRVNPARKAGIEAGQNVTLTCIASGDPIPNITWTKDGVSQDHFNVSGHKLHLVNLQRKDVGSYRCTASNRYGSDASSASIVGVNCKCLVKPCRFSLLSKYTLKGSNVVI